MSRICKTWEEGGLLVTFSTQMFVDYFFIAIMVSSLWVREQGVMLTLHWIEWLALLWSVLNCPHSEGLPKNLVGLFWDGFLYLCLNMGMSEHPSVPLEQLNEASLWRAGRLPPLTRAGLCNGSFWGNKVSFSRMIQIWNGVCASISCFCEKKDGDSVSCCFSSCEENSMKWTSQNTFVHQVNVLTQEAWSIKVKVKGHAPSTKKHEMEIRLFDPLNSRKQSTAVYNKELSWNQWLRL